MTRPQSCPRCFAPLRPSESPEGLCPKCLLAVAMGEDALIRTATGEPAPAPPAIDALAPHFPGLEILALIGRGGSGAVYRAIQKDLGRLVALKVLLLDPERDPTFGERFLREARAMAGLSHPHIAAVHDAGRAGPYWYLVLELVEGPNLRQVIQSRDLAPGKALDVVRQICSALEYAHEMGVVHRDIKPENVLVGAGGRVKLVDFGLAKLLRPDASAATLTRSSQAMGTWHYMAPEQLRRPSEVDHRADIYSLGVVLYELLTGEVPVGRYEPPSRRARTDARLDAIVDRALEQDPARRYQLARGVREDVERVAAGEEHASEALRETGDRSAGLRSERRARVRASGWGRALGWGFGCLFLGGAAFLLGMLVLAPHSLERSGPASTQGQSSGGRALLRAVGLYSASDAVASLADGTWDSFSQLERSHARRVAVRAPGDAWEQIEVDPFVPELRALADGFLSSLRPHWKEDEPLPGVDELLESAVFPSGLQARCIEVRVGEDGMRTLRGIDRSATRSTGATELRQILAVAPELPATSRELPWNPEELGVTQPLPVAVLDALVAVEEEYLALALARAKPEVGPPGVEPTFSLAPFAEERADLFARLFRTLDERNVPELSRPLEAWMPLGGKDGPVRLWREETSSGTVVSRHYGNGVTIGSPPDGEPALERFLDRAEQRFELAPFQPEEVGLGRSAPAEALAAVGRAWRRYLAEEARHRELVSASGAEVRWRVGTFADERGAILDDLFAELAAIDPAWTANGGSVTLVNEVFELGEAEAEVHVRAREDGRIDLRTARGGEVERLRLLDELGWRYGRFRAPE